VTWLEPILIVDGPVPKRSDAKKNSARRGLVRLIMTTQSEGIGASGNIPERGDHGGEKAPLDQAAAKQSV
jgi:hypothetical protein